MNRLLFILILACCSLKSRGQDFYITTFGEKDGLPNAAFNDLLEDSLGFLWLTSDQGAYLFNGKEFQKISQTKFSKLKNITNAISLAISPTELLKLSNGHFEQIPFPEQTGPAPFTVIFDATYSPERNIFWLLTNNGIYSLSRGVLTSITQIPIQEDFSRAQIDFHSGMLQLMTTQGKLYQWPGSGLPTMRKRLMLDLHAPSTPKLFNGPDEYVATDWSHIFTVDKKSATVTERAVTLPPGELQQLQKSVDRMYAIVEGKLWYAHENNSRYEFKRVLDGGEPHRVLELPFDNTIKMSVSENGNLWAIHGSGIALIKERAFKRIHPEIPTAYFKHVVFMDSGYVFLESDIGMFQVKKKSPHEYELIHSPDGKEQSLSTIGGGGKRLWIAGLNYHLTFVENNKTSQAIDLSYRGTTLFHIVPDSHGNTWVSQAPGLKPIVGILKITPDYKVVDYGREAGLENRILVTKEAPDGAIYLAGIGEHTYLYKYDPDADEFINLSVEMKFEYGENFEVHDLAIGPDGIIWLASTAGLLKYSNGRIEKIIIEELYDNEAVSVVALKDGSIWFGTDRSGAVHYKNGRYSIYNQRAGFGSNSMSYRSLYISADSVIWGCTQEGVFVSTQEAQQWRKTKTPILLGITDAKGNTLAGNSYPNNQKLNFNFVSLSHPVKSIVYSYRLKGFNNDRWTPLPKYDSVILTNLKAGKYELQIRGREAGGYEWSEPLSYQFNIEKIWYLQPTALGFYLIMGIIAVISAVRLYNVNLINKKKILERRVDERTMELSRKNIEIVNKNDEISSQFEELRSMSDEISRQHDNLLAQKEVIERQNLMLTKSKIDLERMVIQRTQDLSLTNQELTKQNLQLEQFAFMMAHNLRAPVAQLIGLTNIFDMTDDVKPFNAEVINRISESAKNLDEVIRDIGAILSVKNSVAEKFTKIDLQTIVNLNVKRFDHALKAKKITITNNVRNYFILGIEPYLHSIFTNLITNSIKYADKKKQSLISIDAFETKTQIILIFSDNGIGFDSKQNQDKLFKPFSRFSNHQEGKGLGLHLIFIEINAMNGSVSIQSEENKGTIVTLNFQKYHEPEPVLQ